MRFLSLLLLTILSLISCLSMDVNGLNPVLITVEDLVDSFTEDLLSLNNQIEEENNRSRRSLSSSSSSSVSEYLKVSCNLTCSLQLRGATDAPKHVLYCSRVDPTKEQPSLWVRSTCVEHRSGKLLHMSLSTNGLVADYIDEDFAQTVWEALRSLSPEPEFLYLTMDVPLRQARQVDFMELGPKLRRLAINLAQTTSVETDLVANLSLESLSIDGCRLKSTRVFNEDQGAYCTIDLIYACPQIGEVVLAADMATKQKHCRQAALDTPGAGNSKTKSESGQTVDSLNCCSCRNFQPLIEAIYSKWAERRGPTENLADGKDYKKMFFLSLATNLLLTCILLLICLVVFVFSLRNERTDTKKEGYT